MFITGAGLPAGYGYSTIASVEGEDIFPAMKEYLIQEDKDYTGAPIIIQHMIIYVDKECKVSINHRAPVSISVDRPLEFDCRGVHNIVFDTSGVNYNIIVSY